MERPGDAERQDLAGAVLREGLDQPRDRVVVAGDRHLRRAVVVGDDRASIRNGRRNDPVDVGGGHPDDGGHGAACALRRGQPAALRHQAERVREREHAGGDKGAELTERVPGNVGRPELLGKGGHAARLAAVAQAAGRVGRIFRQCLEESDARGEDRRLRDPCVVQPLGRTVEADLAQLVAEDPVRLLEHRAGAGRSLVDRAAHAHDLRSLAGENERERRGHGAKVTKTRHPGADFATVVL